MPQSNCSPFTQATNWWIHKLQRVSVFILSTLQNGPNTCLRQETRGHRLKVILLSLDLIMAYAWDIWLNLRYTDPAHDTWTQGHFKESPKPILLSLNTNYQNSLDQSLSQWLSRTKQMQHKATQLKIHPHKWTAKPVNKLKWKNSLVVGIIV